MNQRPHFRQFVIGPKSAPAYPDWVAIQLGQDLWLSHCPSLNVHQGTNSLGEQVFILGTPVECSTGHPEDRIPEVTKENYRSLTDTWTNRWCLIVGDSICTDPGSLQALFYKPEPGANPFVSSSVRLLANYYPGCEESVRGVSYGPATPHKSAWQLLPGQWLNLRSGEIVQPAEPLFDQVAGSVDELRAEYASLLKNALAAIAAREGRQLAISLSGGADSRRNLAAAQAARVDFQAFTFRKAYWTTSDADLNLPRVLGRRIGHDVLVIDTRDLEPNPDEGRTYREHAGFRDRDTPGELFYYNVRQAWKGLSVAQVDGQAYELIANYYYKETSAFSSMDEMLNWRFESTPESRQASKLYLERAAGGSMTDLRDFVFLLANMTTYGQMYQAMDLWSSTYCPANCRRMYSIAQSVPVEMRQDKRFILSVTDVLEPRFAGIPTNPPDAPFKRAVQLVRHLGPWNLARILMRKAARLGQRD
jgi:hypothetical protein